ncbi:large subunit ribosomal protein L25 [Lachnotalea glycerini]|nr:50S ribosomal protein L25/general stress protein Ctc [Lachnotalea glycerini]PXV95681.1 large subunit ribosomal protein L25 [Lachnotalea glycerini]
MNVLKTEIRDANVKSKKLRREGLVPCCVYGPNLEKSISIQINKSNAMQLLRKKREGNQVEIEVNGEKMVTLINEISYNTLKNEIEHISFHVLDPNKKVNSVAQIALLNTDMVSGIVEQILFNIPYAALPEDFVDVVFVDLAKIGNSITVADLDMFKNKKVDILIDADTMVLKIVEKKIASQGIG